MASSSVPPPTTAPGGPPPRRNLRGARALTFGGVAALALAVVVGGLAVVLALRTLPTDVLDRHGDDGAGVLVAVPVPGSGSVELSPGDHAVYLARPAGAGATPSAQDALTVTGPDGEPVRLRSPGVSGETTMGGTTASTITGFSADVAGTYTVTAVADGLPDDARVLVVTDAGFGTFFGGLAGTIAGVFTAVVLGIVGVTLTVTGGVLWYLRTRPTRPAGAVGPGGAA
ncbi:hypothetical protein GXB85_08065 [Cellulomonas sp. APG4]|uniref:hypothetical protein n=1 Tax=Cellulomonas sp. APG4 TaxID=1538656 RepID=UPI001379CFF5|nr:hypothetical protein [Cellulomonas sp. APG4]NCT90902.1 hypothetical protein [Cellulomonas sp. APG4]